jgi:signal transduction histidine kinase
MTRFYRTLVFRHTIFFVGLLVALEAIIFVVLYWSTVAVYEQRQNAEIHAELEVLLRSFEGQDVAEMAAIVNARCLDEPGENDELLLASREFEFIAGNVKEWPDGTMMAAGLIDVNLGNEKEVEYELHRVRLQVLPSGHNLLVGRNLTQLAHFRRLIAKALLRTVGLTLVLGVGGGYLYSRTVSTRLDRINKNSRAILTGDISRRMPVTPDGDELDLLSDNLNRMLDRIESLMEGMRTVADNIAHDMRKPISRLRSRIELTLMGQRDSSEYREALVRTIEELDGVLTMFNALLTIAVTESGAAREFEQVDLAEIARSTVELYEPVAEDAGIKLELKAPRPVGVSGNPHLITQALANLVDNAIKYAPGTGVVSILAYEEHGEARLGVVDRGPGIPADFREKAMDRFTRLEPSRSTAGSGLGLSLVRAVAQLHGGEVTLGDDDPGLSVILSFPA